MPPSTSLDCYQQKPRTHPKKLLLLLPALLLIFAGCPKTVTVSPRPEADIVVAADGSGDYEEITEALDAADDGDIIYVAAGTYEEEVELELDNVTLLGAGPGKTIIDADGEYAALSLSGDDCTVEGFSLTGGESHGLYVKDGHHNVSRCLIYGNDDRGIYLSNMFGTGTAVIEYCTIVDNDVSGIYSIDDPEETEIRFCIVARNDRGIVSDEDLGGMTIDYNVFDNEGENFDRVPEGDGNVEDDPKFVDPEDGNYRLKKSSPAIDIDGEGHTAGCFQ